MTQSHDDDIVRVATADSSAQAHIMQNALEGEGIECRVVGDMLEAGIGDVPGLRAELWVHRKDAERAVEILREHRESAGGDEEEEEE